MSKKILFITVAVLLVASAAMGQQWWWYNKTIMYFGAQPAYDLDVIVRPNVPANLVFIELFQNFSQRPWPFPAGPWRLFHWFNPVPGPLNWGGIVHIGAGGPPGGGRILFMYFTDQNGNRIPRSLCWNANSRILYISWKDKAVNTTGPTGDVKLFLINDVTPMDEEGNPSNNEWDAPRKITARDIRYAVVDKPLPLEFLNDKNTYLNKELLQPLSDEVVIPYNDSAEFIISGVSLGQYVIVRWDNFAPPVGGSDSTQARDWFQFLVEEEPSSTGIKEYGLPEPTKLLEVNSFLEHPEIHYQLPKTAKVTLAVYSVAGERVTTLVDETKQAGAYTVSWNDSKVPAGVYIARLSVDGINAAEKMVRVK